MKTIMRIKCLMLLFVLLFAMLSGCSVLPYEEAPYKKITPQEAESMMSGDVFILDVRTQEEFDDGHIKNAVLIPDCDVKEKAESIIPDKNRTILIYCRTGIRSEAASKELLRMGYAKVFDFGGIVDWPGEIVDNWLYSSYYNYFGGGLPPDIITPIDFTVSKTINDKMPEFTFHMTGSNEQRYGTTYDGNKYYIMFDENKIEKITIRDNNGAVIQEITNLETANPESEEKMYGLSFDDWNFDGFFDISLWQFPGGTMHNNPTYYWLWDNNQRKFIENTELEEISNYSTPRIETEAKQITGYSRYGGEGGIECYFEYRGGSFVMVKSIERTLKPSEENEGEYVAHVVIEERIDGKMKVTKDYYEDVSE